MVNLNALDRQTEPQFLAFSNCFNLQYSYLTDVEKSFF